MTITHTHTHTCARAHTHRGVDKPSTRIFYSPRIILFFVIVIWDIFALQLKNSIFPIDFHGKSSEYLDLVTMQDSIETEGQMLAVVWIVLYISLLLHCRTMFKPVGPMIHSIVSTISSPLMLEYLVILMLTVTAFSLSFNTTFGRHLPGFTSLAQGWLSLWRMPFAEEWTNLDLPHPTGFSTFMSLFFLLFAMILLNLFIAIILNVYFEMNEHSVKMWEERITVMLQSKVRKDKSLNTFHSILILIKWFIRWYVRSVLYGHASFHSTN